MPPENSSARISPTAHYTGYVWFRNDLSHPSLMTREGWLLYRTVKPMIAAYGLVGGPSLERMLLARHHAIDTLLERAIESGEVSQVVEVAAGLSPRGYRFRRRYDVTYVEGDLPAMAARKRRILGDAGLLGPGHHVVSLDALATGGPESIVATCMPLLDPDAGTAVITEGLVNYFDPESLAVMWQNFADLLGRFPRGLYLSDLHTDEDAMRLRGALWFKRLLGMFARGEVHMHFRSPGEVQAALERAGFSRPQVPFPVEVAPGAVAPGRSGEMLRIVNARTGLDFIGEAG